MEQRGGGYGYAHDMEPEDILRLYPMHLSFTLEVLYLTNQAPTPLMQGACRSSPPSPSPSPSPNLSPNPNPNPNLNHREMDEVAPAEMAPGQTLPVTMVSILVKYHHSYNEALIPLS